MPDRYCIPALVSLEGSEQAVFGATQTGGLPAYPSITGLRALMETNS